jgi:hypothetical protein
VELGQGLRRGIGIVDAGEEQREGDVELVAVASHLPGVDRRISRDLVGQAHDLEAARVVFPVQANQYRRGIVTGRTPAAEDVHHDDLVPETGIALAHHSTVEIWKREPERPAGVRRGDLRRGLEMRRARAPHGDPGGLGPSPA